MMKFVSCLAAGVAALAFTTAASAQNEVINLGNVTLAGGQSTTIAYNGDPNNLTGVQGFIISFDFDDSADTFAYASDLQVNFDGWGYNIGGFDTDVNAYSFQGFQSDPAGFYSHDGSTTFEANPLSKTALTGFTLKNDYSFNGPVSWNNITITLVKVPAPGALALLGVAGMVGRGRRRR